MQSKSIAVIGAGPGGLALARLLMTRGIASTVFERDQHALARPQGGSLDIHSDSGQVALREAGLEVAFRALARYDDQWSGLYDHHAVLHIEQDEPSGPDRPEIDRTQLRDLLLHTPPTPVVRWGTKITGIQALPDGRHRVRCGEEDGGDFDLIVGADGAWSRVRPLLSNDEPRYTGLMAYELAIDDVDARHPAIASLIPRGKIAAKGRWTGFIAQRSSNSHVRVYVMFRVPEADIEGFVDVSEPARARAQLKSQLPSWSPRLLEFIDACRDTIVARPIVALPVGHRWTHRAGLTLLGDAAHVMPPFGGNGVNEALTDAVQLALRLAATEDWDHAVLEYEKDMFERIAPIAESAMEGLAFISEDGLGHSLRHAQELKALEQADVATGDEPPAQIFDGAVAARTADAALQAKVRGAYRFDLSGPKGGTWIADFRPASAGVRRSDEPVECTIAMSDDDFVSMIAGRLGPRAGFMTGRIKVRGNMGLAMRIGDVVEALKVRR
jgi:2-polyprenyl-6-methoxyphenol hydroxylase-like FAD-dependent oxidoreductase